MDPVYSRDECIATIRDYYEFLAKMFIDRSCIVEPPQGGWPSITAESMQGMRKTEKVIQLLKHMPYIADRPLSDHAEGLPGCTFNNWATTATGILDGKNHARLELDMTEGIEAKFGARIPKNCIGLMYAGRDRDVVLLHVTYGLVIWMACPDKILEASFPKPSTLVYPLPEPLYENSDTRDEERITVEDGEDEASEDGRENDSAVGEETPPTSDDGSVSTDNGGDDQNSDDMVNGDPDDDDSSIELDDDDEMNWGPCWPIRHFFEMLKNHYRCLNFIPRDAHHVIDIWTDSTVDGDPIPVGIPEMLQGIYRKHGWPDLNKYRKEECLAEVVRELDEKYPNNYLYWQ
jgi:hypothetical protein